MKTYVVTAAIWLAVSALLYADDKPVNSLEGVVEAAVEAGHNHQEGILREAISDEYLGAVQRMEAFFKKKGSVVSDIDFYTIVSINKIIPRGEVAFVEASVLFDPKFLGKHQNSITGNMTAALWTNTGGYGLSNKFEENGTGRVTYYLVKQHGLWKLHYSYFSLESLKDTELTTANDRMKTLVHSN